MIVPCHLELRAPYPQAIRQVSNFNLRFNARLRRRYLITSVAQRVRPLRGAANNLQNDILSPFNWLPPQPATRRVGKPGANHPDGGQVSLLMPFTLSATRIILDVIDGHTSME